MSRLQDTHDSVRPDEPAAPTFWQTVGSVLAAFFGVQTAEARRRDFTRGKAWHYIAIGLAATIVFVLVLVGIVKLILAGAGV